VLLCIDLATHGSASYHDVRPWRTALLASGGIQIEWRGEGGELTVEFYPDGRPGSFTVEICDGETMEYDREEPDDTDLVRTIRRIVHDNLTNGELNAGA
jgi:hypothetical protein